MTLALEVVANAVTTASIFLAARNNVHTWWTGIIGCVLFAVVFFTVNLYADVVLQLFFVVTSALGWWQWQLGASGRPLSVSKAGSAQLAWIIPVGIAATAGYGALLHFFTNAYAPFVDSAVLVFSVIAQLLLMKRRIEAWPFWLLVNTIAVPLYASRELYVTSFLYAAYWLNALIAWWSWRKMVRESVYVGAV